MDYAVCVAIGFLWGYLANSRFDETGFVGGFADLFGRWFLILVALYVVGKGLMGVFE